MTRTIDQIKEGVVKAADKGKKQHPRLDSYTAHELQRMELPPLRWVIDGLIVVGLWILAGPPKVGKSYLVMDLLLALSTGGLALGKIRVDETTVCYLALEDNARRLRFRLSHLALDESGWPHTVHFINSAPRLDAGLLPALEAWLDEHPGCRIIVIDTLARVRGKRNREDDSYTADSSVMEGLQEIAMRRDLAVMILHHVRKAPGIDIFETVSGTYGLTGPADGLMILQRTRGEADATLHITGRDVEERELALSFDGRAGSWKLMGDAQHYAQSTARRTLVETVTAKPGLTPKEIAELAGVKRDSCRHLLIRLRDEGKLRSDDKGRNYPVHSVHGTPEAASSTAPEPVDGSEVSHSQIHSPNPPVNAVNGRDRDTITRLYTTFKRGQIKDERLAGELGHLFAQRPAQPAHLARLEEIASEVLA